MIAGSDNCIYVRFHVHIWVKMCSDVPGCIPCFYFAISYCDLIYINFLQICLASQYCKSTNFGVLLYLANLANCVFSLIFVAANIYVDRTLHRWAAGRRKFNSRQITLFWKTPNLIAAKICWFTVLEIQSCHHLNIGNFPSSTSESPQYNTAVFS